MDKILVIAEKPSVARDIAKVLKSTQKGEGYLYGDRYIISWAVGHLVTLCEPEDYNNSYKKWKRSELPIIPTDIKLKAVDKTKPQLKILYNLINREDVKSLICATDSGREGELIFRYIYEICNTNKPFKRLWISSMTDEAITHGFETLKDGKEFDNLFYSAKCRSEADWLVGINATRAFTLKHDTFLSVGRVQTPTLSIIVERNNEIINFVPENYYELNAKFENTNNEIFDGKWYDEKEKSSRISELEKIEEIKSKVDGKEGTIKSVKKSKKKIKPPFLYDLTELQRDGNNKYGMSAKQTLDVAQSLYEKHKSITYPRTDSRFLSNDMKGTIKPLIETLNKIEKFEKYTEKLLDLEVKDNKRIFDDKKITDHHAIIPTLKVNINNMTTDEKKIYFLVVKRFLAVFYNDYEYNSTVVLTDVQGETFISKGQVVIKLGWRELYQTDKKDEKDEKDSEDDKQLPELSKGENVALNESTVETKKTSPPPKFNEATLLSAMENPTKFVEDEELHEQLKDGGIGTPATRASIIERLLSVGYITRSGKTLEPTEKGIRLIEVCPEELRSPATTGKWEKGLSKIAKGEMQAEKFMGSINRYVKFIVEDADRHGTVKFPEDTYKTKKTKITKSYGSCPICEKGQVLKNSKAYFCTEWKNGCKMTIWDSDIQKDGLVLSDSNIKTLIKNGELKKVEAKLSDNAESALCDVMFNKQTMKLEVSNIRSKQ